jgi:hypothetical protein
VEEGHGLGDLLACHGEIVAVEGLALAWIGFKLVVFMGGCGMWTYPPLTLPLSFVIFDFWEHKYVRCVSRQF